MVSIEVHMLQLFYPWSLCPAGFGQDSFPLQVHVALHLVPKILNLSTNQDTTTKGVPVHQVISLDFE